VWAWLGGLCVFAAATGPLALAAWLAWREIGEAEMRLRQWRERRLKTKRGGDPWPGGR
jgi:hypothetical protein